MTSYSPGPARWSPEPMYTADFAKNPHATHERWRSRYGSVVPVELAPGVPATLILGYRTALRILNDPDRFPADPRIWQQAIDPGCPVLPMMQWRPNALRSSGAEHARYRRENVAALGSVDLYGMRAVVEHIATPLISAFCRGDGYQVPVGVDLLTQYVYPLVYSVLASVLGFDDDTNQRVGAAMATMFNSGPDADVGASMLVEALDEHIDRKRAQPGADITSRLIGAGRLSTEELIHQLVTLHGAGTEPQVHLIANTVLLMMTDRRFAGDLVSGSLSTRDALDEVLFTNPPLANFCISYPLNRS